MLMRCARTCRACGVTDYHRRSLNRDTSRMRCETGIGLDIWLVFRGANPANAVADLSQDVLVILDKAMA